MHDALGQTIFEGDMIKLYFLVTEDRLKDWRFGGLEFVNEVRGLRAKFCSFMP